MNSLDRTLLLVQAGSTLPLVGLIWMVQVVHYPLIDRVGRDVAAAYCQAHGRLITWIVAPLMLAEAGSTLGLLWTSPPAIGAAAVWVGAVLLAAIWLSTALLQVPQHNMLVTGFEQQAHRKLVSTNWVRTLAWTARGALVLWMIAQVVG